jgi:RHS repeat-associated protein
MQYEYSYNIEGMLEAKSASGKTLLRYTYDKNNNIKTIKDITGKSSIYSYDEANRVELIKDDNVQSLVTISSTGEVLVDYNYAYDLNGNRLQKVSSKHKNYYTYDSMNRVTDSSYDGRKESFTYDKVGNRLTKITNDITEKYVYNVKNQLKELHNKNGINYFTHDKQGNTIKEETQAGNNIFEYNTLNQQVKAITKDGNTLVNRYDTEGLRCEIEENEKLTKFIFHRENVLVETDKDYNSISRFTRGYEVVAADILNEESEENRYYYTQDEHGSTIFITDKNQGVRNEYYYDAFGNVLEAQEEVHNRITYAGQQYDGIAGQYYLRARFYNPVIGRFTQEDTYRGDGLNLYAYCRNNPVGHYDPSGYSSISKENSFNNSGYKGYAGDLMSPEEAARYSEHWRELGMGSDNTWKAFSKANPGKMIDDYFELVNDMSPWPIGKSGTPKLLKSGDRFYMAVENTASENMIGGFGVKEKITSTQFVWKNLAVKSNWKSTCNVIREFEVNDGVSLNVLEGPVGPQIDLPIDSYLPGDMTITQYDLFSGLDRGINRGDYVHIVDEFWVD